MSNEGSSSYDPIGSLVGGSPVLDVVGALLEHDTKEGLRVVELGEQFATLVGRSGKPVRVFRTPPLEAALAELIDQLLENNSPAGMDVVFVGGSETLESVFEAAIPKLLMNPFVAFHLADGGGVGVFPLERAKKSGRAQVLRGARRLSASERAQLIARIESHAQSFHEERRERARFFKGLSGRRPKVTIALLGAIAAMFFLQSLWAPSGGSQMQQNMFTIAMGALYTPLIDEGQWWRLISVGFLHDGFMHVAMNGFVLYLLGGQVERVLGGARFLVLYTLSLLGGSLASAYLGHGFSVGASGAVWGLLGAQVSLAYGRPPVLPRSIAEALKPMAKQNILLNLGISFLPGIDAAAHIGGGVTGALVLMSGLLYPTGAGKNEEEKALKTRQVPQFVWIVAGACALLLASGVVLALSEGQPWHAEAALRQLEEARL